MFSSCAEIHEKGRNFTRRQHIHRTEYQDEWTVLHCVRKVEGSNFGPKTDYPS